jgi:hypothetical protein
MALGLRQPVKETSTMNNPVGNARAVSKVHDFTAICETIV